MNLKIAGLVLITAVIAFIGYFIPNSSWILDKVGTIISVENNKINIISSFEECQAAGYPIMESYPEQCKTPDGLNFIRKISSSENSFGNLITLSINENIKFEDGLSITLSEINDSRCKPEMVCVWAGELSPTFTVMGGNMGSLPQEIQLGALTAKEVTKNGYTFELKNVTENTASIVVTKEPKSFNACYIGGCSGQICSDKEGVVSTCEYKEEYSCYKTAKCERQPNGQCGWTQTSALQACLSGG